MARLAAALALVSALAGSPAFASESTPTVSDSVDEQDDLTVAEPVAPYNAQVACIEQKESHGQNVWRDNTPPAPGTDKPGGVLQYFEWTFASHAATMGHPEYSRWVPWQARTVADFDLRVLGLRRQWSVGGC